MQLWV